LVGGKEIKSADRELKPGKKNINPKGKELIGTGTKKKKGPRGVGSPMKGVWAFHKTNTSMKGKGTCG